MEKILWVGMGGFLGAVSRFGVSLALRGVTEFPVATLAVNGLGCFIAGLLSGYFREQPAIFLFVGTGFLGAFTTFSAFGMETMALIQLNQVRLALVNVAANLVISLGAVAFGGWVAFSGNAASP